MNIQEIDCRFALLVCLETNVFEGRVTCKAAGLGEITAVGSLSVCFLVIPVVVLAATKCVLEVLPVSLRV